jgi:hypothetical protein
MMDGVIELPSQPDLPVGATLKCMECGTRLRKGQPHTAITPWPHQTLSLLIVTECIDDDDAAPYVRGSHAGTTGFRPSLRAETGMHRRGHEVGRRLTNPLVQGPDLVWREAR